MSIAANASSATTTRARIIQASSRWVEMDSDQSVIGIIDDDISMREALDGLISSFEFATSTYASALEFLKAAPPPGLACLVVDVKMPGMSGLDLQSALIEAGRQLPIIFVTSFTDASVRTRALAAGAQCVLGKPVDRDELMHQIDMALNGGPRAG